MCTCMVQEIGERKGSAVSTVINDIDIENCSILIKSSPPPSPQQHTQCLDRLMANIVLFLSLVTSIYGIMQLGIQWVSESMP